MRDGFAQLGDPGDQYRRLLRAKGKPKATTAAARKLCCYIYWMWRDGLSYEEWLADRAKFENEPHEGRSKVWVFYSSVPRGSSLQSSIVQLRRAETPLRALP